MYKKTLNTEPWIVKLKESGSVQLRVAGGSSLRIVKLSLASGVDLSRSLFLLHELFQLRSIAKPFSDVSLDIVEWSEEPVIFQTERNPMLNLDQFTGKNVRFALIKDAYWRYSLRAVGEIVLGLPGTPDEEVWDVVQPFSLFSGKTKEIYLSAEGVVKMLK